MVSDQAVGDDLCHGAGNLNALVADRTQTMGYFQLKFEISSDLVREYSGITLL